MGRGESDLLEELAPLDPIAEAHASLDASVDASTAAAQSAAQSAAQTPVLPTATSGFSSPTATSAPVSTPVATAAPVAPAPQILSGPRRMRLDARLRLAHACVAALSGKEDPQVPLYWVVRDSKLRLSSSVRHKLQYLRALPFSSRHRLPPLAHEPPQIATLVAAGTHIRLDVLLEEIAQNPTHPDADAALPFVQGLDVLGRPTYLDVYVFSDLELLTLAELAVYQRAGWARLRAQPHGAHATHEALFEEIWVDRSSLTSLPPMRRAWNPNDLTEATEALCYALEYGERAPTLGAAGRLAYLNEKRLRLAVRNAIKLLPRAASPFKYTLPRAALVDAYTLADLLGGGLRLPDTLPLTALPLFLRSGARLALDPELLDPNDVAYTAPTRQVSTVEELCLAWSAGWNWRYSHEAAVVPLADRRAFTLTVGTGRFTRTTRALGEILLPRALLADAVAAHLTP